MFGPMALPVDVSDIVTDATINNLDTCCRVLINDFRLAWDLWDMCTLRTEGHRVVSNKLDCTELGEKDKERIRQFAFRGLESYMKYPKIDGFQAGKPNLYRKIGRCCIRNGFRVFVSTNPTS